MTQTNWTDAKALVAQAQQVVDARRQEGRYPLAWLIEALYLGDVGALAAAAASRD